MLCKRCNYEIITLHKECSRCKSKMCIDCHMIQSVCNDCTDEKKSTHLCLISKCYCIKPAHLISESNT